MTDDKTALADDALHKFLILNRYLRLYARQTSKQGIGPRDFSVLRFLLENDSATVGEVKKYLYRSPSTTSTIIANLEEAGYVVRTRSAKDNRVVNVTLTPAGQDIAQNTPMGGIPLLRRRLPTLTTAQLHTLIEALDTIMQLMEVEEIE